MLNFNTNNYNFEYKNIYYNYNKYSNNLIIIEIYRHTLYLKFKKYIEKIRNLTIKKKNITNLEKNNFITLIYLYDMVSLFIINHKFKSKFDPLFDSVSPFTIKNIQKYFNNKCIPTISTNLINSLLDILPLISQKYINCYKKLRKYIKYFNKIKYDILYEENKNLISLKLNILESDDMFINKIINKLIYNSKIKMSQHIFNHLIKLYNTNELKQFNNFEIIDKKVIDYIYIIFTRYYSLSSGNNQASILPSFKKIIKEKLNIKIELFGSPLNTSSFTFGSLFYDIDKYFGSFGNYFNTKILKGYYELNPIFDKCLIDKIYKKCYDELLFAEENKYPLLFLMILPSSYFKFSDQNNILNNFKKFEIMLDREKFPYIRYNRNFLQTKVSPIVDTHIIIYHTEFINNVVKQNVLNFNYYLDNWLLKKKL